MTNGPTGPTGSDLPHEPPTPKLGAWQKFTLWVRQLFR
jgi:hypothetical protein